MGEGSPSMQKKDLVFLLALVVILFGIYWKTFDYDLIWDDEIFFKYNILFIENHPLGSAFKFAYFSEQLGVQGQDHYYRPLLTASFLLENKLWGIRNVSLRLTNLVIYFLALVFLFFFLKRQKEYPYFPEIVTLLFALYPLNTDNIVWVVGRGDLLMLLWAMLCFLFLDLSLTKRRGLYLFLSSACFLLGILSKETFVFFLPALLVYEAVKRRRITTLYHLANLGFTALFFFVKIFVLDIKNMKFVLRAAVGEDIKATLGTLGYYFRTMIFPLRFDMFVPVQETMKAFYVGFGIAAMLLVILLLLRSIKNTKLLFPTVLLMIFLGAHTVLVFTDIFPFQIYSRYMLMAGLALIWLLAVALKGIRERPRFVVTFAILILFIPAIVLNGNSYKNSTVFWERAQQSLPRNAYVLFQSAKAAFENKNYLSAELSLNRTLSLDMKRETAILVSLLYSDLEIVRADYPSALRWLDSIEEFESQPRVRIAPFIRYQLNEKRAKVEVSRGNLPAAEVRFEDNLARYSNVKESYIRPYDAYIGRGLWEKAAALEKAMKLVFPNYFRQVDTAGIESEFEKMPFDEKMSFYIQYRNFDGALSLLQTLPNLDVDHQLLLTKLYYDKGLPEEGEKVVAGLYRAHAEDTKVLNRIGYFYLSDLLRVKPALTSFDRSLSINRAQPEIISLTIRLRTQYLDKLKPVWQ
jgi:tetratricopeptide (TPR) repeat protein